MKLNYWYILCAEGHLSSLPHVVTAVKRALLKIPYDFDKAAYLMGTEKFLVVLLIYSGLQMLGVR